MAVYTTLTEQDLEEVARAFELGAVRDFAFIPQGSINTNGRLSTSRGRFFLRHTTVREGRDLAFEAALLELLADARFPGPIMLRAEGQPFVPCAGGRACVFRWLAGEELTRARLTPDHLERLGRQLARLHLAGNAFQGDRPNPYGPEVVRGWLRGLEIHPDRELAGIAAFLLPALRRSQRSEHGLLPRGVIHADLFMDNVKWLGAEVAAFFDFEMACRDVLILDVAITLNAWCFDGGAYQAPLCRALLRGYQLERPLDEREREHLYDQALFGAVRYTASRIRDFHLATLPPERLTRKDFRTYLARARTLTQMGEAGFRTLLGIG